MKQQAARPDGTRAPAARTSNDGGPVAIRARPLNRQCAWCGERLSPFVPGRPTTSGICPSCADRFTAMARTLGDPRAAKA